MKKSVTYRDAGVDIDKANVFVEAIQKDIKTTLTSSVLRRKGSFGGLYSLASKKYQKPVLVSSTDGVGTKLLIAQSLGIHQTVGIDLVAMNVNDILCVGAQPLFFLDYIACGKLDPKVLKSVMKGIVEGCRQAGCSLIGGETAEMPDMYKPSEYDLAGFTVGVIEEKRIVDGSKINAGDVVIGLPSSGFHSNGYSLVRKVFSKSELKTMAREILAPTKIYVREVHKVLQSFDVHGMAHITGGAYYEKLTKILPAGLCFNIYRGSWPVPKIFHILQKKGKIDESEMYKTFNMGIGFALVVSAKDQERLRRLLKKEKIQHYPIGEVIRHPSKRIVFNGQ